MNFNSAQFYWFALPVLAVTLMLALLVGRGESSIWPANCVHNWEQYGFSALHGKLVSNPGGFETLEKPDIYKGHRAASFYPVFAVGQLLNRLGDTLLMFHLVFTVALFFSVWHLLGRSGLAAAGAAIASLCPGYTIYPTVIDPNAVALYMVVPFGAIMVRSLAAKKLAAWHIALLTLLTFAYTSLNWSTAFGHGILFCALLALPAVPWTRVGLYLVMAGVSVGIVGALSVLDKMGGGHGSAGAGGGSFLTFLAGYTWGHCGYGADLTTLKAIVRLTAVNTLGLLPLLTFLGWLTWKIRQADGRWDALVFLPLAAAMSGVLLMRNYFGHHPWMAAPMLLPGMIMTLCLLIRRNPVEISGGKKISTGFAFLIISLGYALVVLGAHRAYHSEPLELSSLVLHHTTRTDIIVLVTNLDPQMAAQAEPLSETTDRRVIVLPDLKTPPAVVGNLFVLSATDLSAQLTATAHSEKPALLSLPLVHELSAWYAAHISRRGAQDKHFTYTTGATFGLYRLPVEIH